MRVQRSAMHPLRYAHSRVASAFELCPKGTEKRILQKWKKYFEQNFTTSNVFYNNASRALGANRTNFSPKTTYCYGEIVSDNCSDGIISRAMMKSEFEYFQRNENYFPFAWLARKASWQRDALFQATAPNGSACKVQNGRLSCLFRLIRPHLYIGHRGRKVPARRQTLRSVTVARIRQRDGRSVAIRGLARG